MTKPRVMLDLDGTVYHWERTARYLLRRWYREHTTVDVPSALGRVSRSWDYIQEVVSPEAWHWLWSDGVAKGLFREGHIYTGAGEAIHEMSEFASVVVITHRPASAINDTLEWLAFRRWAISELHFQSNSGDTKSSVQPHAEVYIDDSLTVMQDLAVNTDAHLILVDREWNRDSQWSKVPVDQQCRIERGYDWDDIIDKTRFALKERGHAI